MAHSISVMVHTPAHSGVGTALSYLSDEPLAAGCLVRVPLGQREMLGIVWDNPADSPHLSEPEKLKPITAVFNGIAPLRQDWRQLVDFAAHYYQRSVGEFSASQTVTSRELLNEKKIIDRMGTYKKASPKPSMLLRNQPRLIM